MDDGGYGATVGETGSGKPGLSTVPHEHALGDLDLIRERPYGPAPPRRLHNRPDRWQHPTTCQTFRILLALKGASTDGKRTSTTKGRFSQRYSRINWRARCNRAFAASLVKPSRWAISLIVSSLTSRSRTTWR